MIRLRILQPQLLPNLKVYWNENTSSHNIHCQERPALTHNKYDTSFLLALNAQFSIFQADTELNELLRVVKLSNEKYPLTCYCTMRTKSDSYQFPLDRLAHAQAKERYVARRIIVKNCTSISERLQQ